MVDLSRIVQLASVAMERALIEATRLVVKAERRIRRLEATGEVAREFGDLPRV